jgi:tetratricopeptide (TPR) repeat protein
MLKNSLSISIYSVFLSLLFSVTNLAAAESLDDLFAALKQSPDEMSARELEDRIWRTWFQSGDEQIDELMQQAMQRRGVYDFNGAHELLDQVIDKKPDYAEAWNQRATVYFNQGEHEKSLEAIARTLELEPRHFGSMAGRAVIRLQQGKAALAYQNVVEAMKVHPYLKERAFFPDLISR